MSSRQNQWQQKQREAGKCVKCGKDADGSGPHCAFHKAWNTAYVRARRERLKANTP